jgi:ferredoxin-NADP reductase
VFKAGQYLELTLMNPPETDAEGDGRAFSIASAPSKPQLMVATRLRDTAFKRVLAKLPLGAEVRVEGPFGNLTLHNNTARAAVLLAGGIGITPFRSMAVHAAREHLPHRLLLFYSNRSPEDAAFLGELQALRAENVNYECSHIRALDPSQAGEQAFFLVGGVLGRRFAEVTKGSFQCATLLFVQRLALRLFGNTHQHVEEHFDPPVAIAEHPDRVRKIAFSFRSDDDGHEVNSPYDRVSDVWPGCG